MQHNFNARNIFDLMPNFRKDDEEVAEKGGPRGVKSQGPRKVRHMTNGQVRRAQVRAQKTAARKANRRYRKSWMRNELAYATLRGQLEVMANQPETHGVRILVEKHLIEVYGSVEAAAKHFEAIVEDRMRAAVAARQRAATPSRAKGWEDAGYTTQEGLTADAEEFAK